VKDGADERLPPRSGWRCTLAGDTVGAGTLPSSKAEAFAPATICTGVPSGSTIHRPLSSARRCGRRAHPFALQSFRECLEIIGYAEKHVFDALGTPPR